MMELSSYEKWKDNSFFKSAAVNIENKIIASLMDESLARHNLSEWIYQVSLVFEESTLSSINQLLPW